MRTLTAIFLLIILFGCSDRQLNNNDNQEHSNHFIISAIDGKLPLRLEELNFKDKNNLIQLNDEIVSKIDEVVNDYAKDIELYDSSKTYKDTYINTIRLKGNSHTIFLVLLKHYLTDEVNSRVIFYDNERKEFVDKEFDFKLYALYDYENGNLKAGYLKKLFKIVTPEIEVVDFNNDGINDFKFVRLWHNGTFNAIHTTILTVRNGKIDKLHFDEKFIGNEELLYGRK